MPIKFPSVPPTRETTFGLPIVEAHYKRSCAILTLIAESRSIRIVYYNYSFIVIHRSLPRLQIFTLHDTFIFELASEENIISYVQKHTRTRTQREARSAIGIESFAKRAKIFRLS